MVLAEIEGRGLLPPPKALPFSTNLSNLEASDNRSKAINELLTTERRYVADMQELMVSWD
jgi:hypothetical protein